MATLSSLRRDNFRLMQDLVDSQRIYHDMLQTTLSEQHMYQQLLRLFLPKQPPISEPLTEGSSYTSMFLSFVTLNYLLIIN